MSDNSFLFVSLIASQKLLKWLRLLSQAFEDTGTYPFSSEFCSHEVNMWFHKGKQWQATLELCHVMNHFRLKRKKKVFFSMFNLKVRLNTISAFGGRLRWRGRGGIYNKEIPIYSNWVRGS